jgi:hypothetical protein
MTIEVEDKIERLDFETPSDLWGFPCGLSATDRQRLNHFTVI